MRYKFTGGVDVPEWLLAEVSLLSAVSCVRLKLLCRAVCLDLSGAAPLDAAKAATLLSKGREGGTLGGSRLLPEAMMSIHPPPTSLFLQPFHRATSRRCWAR